MKLFVTGATGFIGSHFLNAAHAAGHEIVALRRSAASQPRIPLPFFNEEQSTRNEEPQTTWLDKEIPAVTAADLAGCDALVHLAAGGVTPQPATWELCYRVNVIESLRLCELALDAGERRIVAAGSYVEYGRIVVGGSSTEYGLAGLRFDPIPPDAPLEPTDPYAASKASASIAMCALCRARKFELAYLRLFSVFGDGQYEKNFWPQLRAAALAGEDFAMTPGEQVRDFIPVEDVAARLLLSATECDLKPGEPRVENLASGQPVTLRTFAEHWWAKWGAKGQLVFGAQPYRSGEVMRYVPLV